MRITVTQRKTWIPDFDENMGLPESERIRITYSKPKAYQRSGWIRTCATRTPDGDIATFIDRDVKAIILESDVTVENLIIVDGGTEKEISTGRDLVEASSDVCAFICTSLAREITATDFENELKN